MTNRYKKIEKMSSAKEIYEYGFDKGFGECLGRVIGFLRKYNLDIFINNGTIPIDFINFDVIEELKEFVLKKDDANVKS